jgi:hypothetical protein
MSLASAVLRSPAVRVLVKLNSTAMSRLVVPAGLELRMVPAIGVSVPLEPIEKPATVAVAELST